MVMLLKKSLVLLSIFALGLQLTACSTGGNVRLCDYKNIPIPKKTITVSDEDVRLSVQMQMAEKNPELEMDTLTDDLAKQYFHAESAADVFETVRAGIAEHRAFDYAYEMLLNNSLLKGNNQERKDFFQKVMNRIEHEAAEANLTPQEYVRTAFGTSLLEYMNSAGSFYDEFQILQEFMKAEDIEVTAEEFNEYLQTLALDAGVTAAEFLEQYAEEVILYSIYLERSYDALLEYLNY